MNIRAVKTLAVSRKVLAIAAAGFFSSAGAAVSNLNLLVEPRQLKNMKPQTVTAPVGMYWYETSTGNRTVRVLWDEKAAIPRRVMPDDKSGTARKRMTAKNIAAPQGAPWALLSGYQQKEYSDYLD